MKRILFLIAACMVLVTACNEDKTTENPKNTAPKCKLTAPVRNAVHDIKFPLIIKGEASDAENNITIVRLTVGEKVIEEVTTQPFEYEFASENLKAGPLTITLYVEDKGGLSATEQVTVTIKNEVDLMTCDDGENQLTAGYWTEEHELHILSDKKWLLAIPDNAWFEFHDSATQTWAKKLFISGTGNTTMKIRSIANDEFEDKHVQLEITTTDEFGVFNITQTASPDMIGLLEDEMLRMAAGACALQYGMDANEDYMVSAYEAEQEPEEGVAYGFDAGGWLVASTKGIENFPHLRHLDVNAGTMSEIDLSGNPDLMSIHVQECNNLKSLDISPTKKLIELGCNYDVFLSALPELTKLKAQIHTLGIFDRQPEQLSTLDFSGYTNLQRLYINDNGITDLNITGCTKLWRLVASGNDFTELDLSEVDRYTDNQYLMDNCPNLKKIYVWKGFTLDYYNLFQYDEGVEIIEK